jgi:galactokinase
VLEHRARDLLAEEPGGAGAAVASGAAPGRCTLVGEHVDYVGGMVLCCPVDRAVAVALRPSADGRWRLVSAGRRVERPTPDPAGDVGDRAFAAAVVLAAEGIRLPALEMAVAADLPEAAGLASSAAVCCAAMVAMLRLAGARLPTGRFVELALAAERDVVGVPCGPLDQAAVVGLPAGGAVLLDCGRGTADVVPWHLETAVLVACDTGETHDVGGAGYRERRAEAEAALRMLGVTCVGRIEPCDIAAARLPEPLDRRARHLVTETQRAATAASALAAGDATTLGLLMSASHASLRDDYEVSTPALDAAVGAALAVPGCLGARLVGAGFGGTAIAVVEAPAAERVRMAMKAAVPGSRGAWRLAHAPGLAVTATDVLEG